jgi:fructan beta-fructosidase
LQLDGKQVWVLLVSINPGGPNGGSATQYFLGDFDGRNFTPMDDEQRWMDHGTDNYAGVTFSNTGARKVLIGWMSNWQYANDVPTEKWRGAFTLPRELSLRKVDGKVFLASNPIKEFDKVVSKKQPLKNNSGLFQLELSAPAAEDFSVVLTNKEKDEVVIGYEKASDKFYVDRTRSGNTSFEKGFAKRIEAPRISTENKIDLKLIADAASVELFADKGLTVMTCIFFPNSMMSDVSIKSVRGINARDVKLSAIKY